MVNDREPRYQLLDSNGNVVGSFYEKSDGTLAVQDGSSESEIVFDGDTLGSGSETVDVGSVSTKEADITNETFVRADRSSDTGSTSAGTFVNAFDAESRDNASEFSSAQFSPSETGEYLIVIHADIRGNTSDGDELQATVRNVTDSTNVGGIDKMNASSQFPVLTTTFINNLDSAKTYELQVTNSDSSFVVKSSPQTSGTISRHLVG